MADFQLLLECRKRIRHEFGLLLGKLCREIIKTWVNIGWIFLPFSRCFFVDVLYRKQWWCLLIIQLTKCALHTLGMQGANHFIRYVNGQTTGLSVACAMCFLNGVYDAQAISAPSWLCPYQRAWTVFLLSTHQGTRREVHSRCLATAWFLHVWMLAGVHAYDASHNLIIKNIELLVAEWHVVLHMAAVFSGLPWEQSGDVTTRSQPRGAKLVGWWGCPGCLVPVRFLPVKKADSRCELVPSEILLIDKIVSPCITNGYA